MVSDFYIKTACLKYIIKYDFVKLDKVYLFFSLIFFYFSSFLYL